jgi:transcriptional regulator with XRE-family HTH domain
MLRVEQIRAFLKDKNLKAFARQCGVSYDTVRRVAMGISNPDYETLVALSDYIEAELQLISGG